MKAKAQQIYSLFQFLIGWLQTGDKMILVLEVQACFNSLQVGYKPFLTIENELSWPSFNSLQVGYKLIVDKFLISTVGSFNSLQVGYKRTQRAFIKQKPKCCFNSLQVGYKHPNDFKGKVKFLAFQFLIGWLQTPSEPSICLVSFKVSIPYRLATNVCPSSEPGKDFPQFQFLIGWLQTVVYPEMAVRLLGVSIPYRLATNSEKNDKYKDDLFGFNSLQVGYKQTD